MRSGQTLGDLPGLLAQVHPDEPSVATAGALAAGSPKRLRWICEHDHSWVTQVRARVAGSGCPICGNKQVMAGVNDLATTHPNLAAEWDRDRNDHSPQTVLAGTPRKAWWVASCGHAWHASIRARAAGSGCPFCTGKRVDQTNSVLSVWSQAAQWWHPDNPDSPAEVHRGTAKARLFRCPEGHEFSDRVDKIAARERKCPTCDPWRLRPGVNDLATLRPDLASQWADAATDPAHTALHDPTPRPWNCPTGHGVFTVSARARINGASCPTCSGRTVEPGVTDLATLRPALLEEWDSAVNDQTGIDPATIGVSSSLRAAWVCSTGHRWTARVVERADRHQTGCPVCSGRRPAPGLTDLGTTHPALAASWHPTRNAPLTPGDVKATSGRRVWWYSAACGHEWQRQIRHRTSGTHRDQPGAQGAAPVSTCDVCSQVVTVPGVNDITALRPDLVALCEDVEALRPCGPGSPTSLRWRCPRGHTWRSPVRRVARLLNDGIDPCSICGGRRVEPGVNDVATTHPSLVEELDQAQHPCDSLVGVSPGSGRRFTWRCDKEQHTWVARLVDRIHHETGCPECAAAAWRSRGEEEVADYVAGLGFAVRRSARIDCEARRFNFDIALDEPKVLIEYNGTYFHSESTGRGADYHADKHRAATSAGWQLITVWEDDWQRRPDVVRALLAHKLGRSDRPRVPARATTLDLLSPDQSAKFLDVHHIQGAGTGSLRLGLRDKDGALAAVLVARFEGRSVNIVRYATSCIVPGGFGKLLAALENQARQRPGVERIKTFSDNLISDGSLYENLGFIHDGDVRPDYAYARGRGAREHKFGYRLERFRRDSSLIWQPDMTERELADLNGLHRIWDAGKRRWVRPLTS